jgi:hypothetical protein
MKVLLWLVIVESVNALAPMRLVLPRHDAISQRLFASPDAEQLRQSAQKLRDEIEILESKLDRKPIIGSQMESAVTYSSLTDSVWTLAYRFASDPPPKDDAEPRPTSNYSGKLTVKFRSDGYTDIVGHDPIGATVVIISKAWGWDKETSNEDEKEYVLFSTDVQLPGSDTAAPNQERRFYWQARVDTELGGYLSLADGSVTIKKDIEPPGGFWGVLNAGGILAQFRQVGSFGTKAELI